MDEFTVDVDSAELTDSVTPLSELQSQSCMKYRVELFLLKLQATVIKILQRYESDSTFRVDKWMKDEGGGGGITCVLQGKYIEKIGCNLSAISGTMSQNFVCVLKKRGRDIPSTDANNTYFATGLSFLLHPSNPYVPVLHFNYRYFEVTTSENKTLSWFGGSCDMFPNYVLEEEFKMFHVMHKNVCDSFNDTFYPRFKKAADEYSLNKHRGEHCGIGGISFDDLDEGGLEKCFDFLRKCACTTFPTYLKIFENHKNDPFSQHERDWQLIRRGRYSEFVLVHGRGTKFGLTTPGVRIESVLMTLPPLAKWEYMYAVKAGSSEEEMENILKSPRDWAT